MTPIEVLLSLELPDAVVARRLQVSRVTVCYWRTKRYRPTERHQEVAVAYLSEIQAKLAQTLLRAAFAA
jgi:hypothetical protein